MDFFDSVYSWISADNFVFLRTTFDFVIIACAIYSVLYFLRGTRSANVLFGVIALLVIAAIFAKEFKFVALGYIFDGMWTIMGISIVIIFQSEIRRAFAQAGSIFTANRTSEEVIGEVVNAAVQMSVSKTGAIIVFEKKIGLAGIVNQSVILDCKVSSPLLQTLFFKNSPLHDMAVIIRNGRIIAARAVLPLTQYNDATIRLGTRHRAAIGITEETDAVAVIVSEETGYISLASKGNLMRKLTAKELTDWLTFLLIGKRTPLTGFKKATPDKSKTENEGHADLFEREDF